ncbi:MAG: 4,5-dihydroxyphthalate decarboxylase [Burkholderiaceae bacterium]|nr:4,5-dihydroxyphthalate decarboxylase [Burkholderiaceae bacterium]MDP3753314.1 4,5-dihydroxyphthalate decarboxylase [Polaromonas sp.]
MNPLSLTLALGPYDHTRDVTDGTVPVEGIALRTLNLSIEEIFYRFTIHREWDVSEMSTGKYLALRARDDPSVQALPIFISRAFRHSMFYVKAGGPIRRPQDLMGKRIGVPEWAQSAGIYGRGYLSDYLGIDLIGIEWIQAGVNEPGRVEKVKLHLPDGLRYRNAPTKSLNELLLAGEVDAIMSARPPKGLGNGIERLMPDYQSLEEQYFKDTNIYPIMHALVVKSSVLDEHAWVAMNLYKAFKIAKDQSLERLSDMTASHAPLAWLGEYTDRMRALFGEDFYPYGVGEDEGGCINRATLEAYCKFGFEQGICARRLTVDELFPPTVLSSFKV